jgi:hypothetical protein
MAFWAISDLNAGELRERLDDEQAPAVAVSTAIGFSPVAAIGSRRRALTPGRRRRTP